MTYKNKQGIKAIFFDMDGTITRPHIDWKALRDRVGVPPGVPIMAHLEALPEPETTRAETVLCDVEYEAAESAEPNPGVAELFDYLSRQPLDLALITNNHRRAMHRVVEKLGLPFQLLLSREDALLKPAPDLLLLALSRLHLAPTDAVFVGDGHYDRAASTAAGIPYIHLAHDLTTEPNGPTIHHLRELPDHLSPDISG